MTDNANILTHFLSAAAAAGTRPFLTEGDRTLVGFDELDRRTGRYAARLKALGGAVGERIVV